MIITKIEYCDLANRGRCMYSNSRKCPYAYGLMNLGDGGKTAEAMCSKLQQEIDEKDQLSKIRDPVYQEYWKEVRK